MTANPPDAVLDVYSNGLAIIFLCELSPQKYAREIEWYLEPHESAAKAARRLGLSRLPRPATPRKRSTPRLSYWEAHRHGFNVDGASVENLADWLMQTQDPDGCWGYQGQVSPSDELIPQTETNCSMLAAGLGSTLHLRRSVRHAVRPVSIDPSATMKSRRSRPPCGRVGRAATRRRRANRFVRSSTNHRQSHRARSNRGTRWMEKNYEIDIGIKVLLLPVRPGALQELSGSVRRHVEESAEVVQRRLRVPRQGSSSRRQLGGLLRRRVRHGVLDRCSCCVRRRRAFDAKLGEGTLLAGRGLPTNLSRAKMRNGQLIVEQVHTKVDELLSMIDDGDEGALDELARDPSQLVVEKVDEKSARRLQQLVRGGEPEVRLLAVRALGRTRQFRLRADAALRPHRPRRRVVLEARNGLRFISRNFEGYGPPDEFTEQQRFEAIDAWKKWYQVDCGPRAMLEE